MLEYEDDYTPPEPPEGLGVAGRDLWVSIVGTKDDPRYELRPDELRVLHDACRASDQIARLEAYLAEPDTPLMVTGSNRTSVLNPAIQEVRMQRQYLLSAMKTLRLPDPADEDDSADVAPLDRPMSRSEAGRKAALARWRRDP